MANQWIDKGPAKSSDDVVVFVRNPRYRKPTKVLPPKVQEGRHIHRVIEKLGRATVAQICQKSGYSLERVREHVNYRVEKGQLKVERAIRTKVLPEQNFTGELPFTGEFNEGAVSQVLVNRFERDPKARIACLKEFGYSCTVCQRSFREEYGEIGEGFIHVHHRRPLALRKAEYRPNPAKDLVPVCPNCHAMLHTSDPPLGIDELREIWRKHGGA